MRQTILPLLLVLPLIGQTVTKKKPKPAAVNSAEKKSSTPVELDIPGDIKGFQKTRWGMSVEQVGKIIELPATRHTPPMKAHGDDWLHLEGPLEINGIKLSTKFFFDEMGEALQTVLMLADKTRSGGYEFDPDISDYNDLRKVLLKKYGASTREGRTTYGMESVWRTPTTTVTISYSNLGFLGKTVSIRYERTMAEDTGKL